MAACTTLVSGVEYLFRNDILFFLREITGGLILVICKGKRKNKVPIFFKFLLLQYPCRALFRGIFVRKLWFDKPNAPPRSFKFLFASYSKGL